MSGYLILEIGHLGDRTFSDVLNGIKAVLDEASIDSVSHVHAAIGADGLRESVAYLLGEESS